MATIGKRVAPSSIEPFDSVTHFARVSADYNVVPL